MRRLLADCGSYCRTAPAQNSGQRRLPSPTNSVYHFAVLPGVPDVSRSPAVLTEDSARDYPQSRYELNLQIAIESGDRAALRRLLARRTVDDAIRLALYMLGFALVVALLFRFVV